MRPRKKTYGSFEIRLFYVAFGIICLANLAYYGHGLLGLSGAIRSIIGDDPVFGRTVLISRIAWFLVICILIWLLAHIFQLIRSISMGEPFGSGNPRRVRKVAHGAIVLASVVFISECLRYFLGPSAQLKMLLYALMGVPMWSAFFGLALQVIARAFEEGLRLKQDEKFTI